MTQKHRSTEAVSWGSRATNCICQECPIIPSTGVEFRCESLQEGSKSERCSQRGQEMGGCMQQTLSKCSVSSVASADWLCCFVCFHRRMKEARMRRMYQAMGCSLSFVLRQFLFVVFAKWHVVDCYCWLCFWRHAMALAVLWYDDWWLTDTHCILFKDTEDFSFTVAAWWRVMNACRKPVSFVTCACDCGYYVQCSAWESKVVGHGLLQEVPAHTRFGAGGQKERNCQDFCRRYPGKKACKIWSQGHVTAYDGSDSARVRSPLSGSWCLPNKHHVAQTESIVAPSNDASNQATIERPIAISSSQRCIDFWRYSSGNPITGRICEWWEYQQQ